MTESPLSQETSDVLDSDLNFNQIPKIQFLLSRSSIASSKQSLNKQQLNRAIERSQFSLETLDALSTANIFDQQAFLIDNDVSEQQSRLNSPFPLSQNLLSILQSPEQTASCLTCGQTGCGCSAQRYQQQKQEQNLHSKQHQAGNTSNHDDHGHSIHGLENDFPIWNTVANSNTATSISASASVAISNTFKLHSNPNAQHTIYLDFTGHTTSGTWWNDGGKIQSSAYDRDGNKSSFSNSELLEIQSIWQQVAEDFAPFNVNVTTQDPGVEALRKTSNSDRQWGVRVLFTDNRNDLDGTAIAAGAGGVAYIGSFNRNVDQPIFVFNKGARAAAVTASHEVGHSLYLNHDGINGQTSYHPGHGSGATSWGTIMGAPFQENLTQWSRGDYYNADNTEDDLAIITTRNGFGYRSDDHGNSHANASTLSINNAGQLSSFGIIERNTDIDYFSFTTGSGNVSFTITPASKAFVGNGSGGYATEYLDAQGANLDIWAGLYNSNGTLLASSNPSNLLTASLDLSLTAGTYFIRIDGVGKDNPLVSGSQGYSDYGSLGQYSILGNVESLSAKVIETVGTASLSTTAVGYQLQGQGAPAQFVRLNGNIVSENTFSGWAAIGVEKLGQGFQLLWKNVDGRYLDWRVDAKGTYQSSQSVSETELTHLETTFLQDLNGDEEIGWASTALETVGTASLSTTAVGYQLQGQGAPAQFVRLNGNIVSENTFSGWAAIGVEKLGQGFQLLWKNVDGRYLDWRVDAKGTYQSSQSISETELTHLETTFLQDLNGDQRIEQASLAHHLRHSDLLIGGPSDQVLVGSARNDLLIKGDSSDQFVFLNTTDEIDTITDFTPGKDLIQISAADFGGDLVGNVHLASEQFGLGVAATTDQERFLYDQLSGYLRYDADGIDGVASIHIATLSSKPGLSHQDIQLVL